MSAKTHIELELDGAVVAFGDMTPIGNLCRRASRFIAEQREAASVVVEEPEGRRWFTAAYRAQNGNVIQIGDETVVHEHAQNTVDEFTEEDDEGTEYFVATRILPPWLPVEQEGENR